MKILFLAGQSSEETLTKKLRSPGKSRRKPTLRDSQPEHAVLTDKGKILGFVALARSFTDPRIVEIFTMTEQGGPSAGEVRIQIIDRILHTLPRRDIQYVMIRTKYPRYYTANFGFKSLVRFREGPLMGQVLMGLELR